MGVGGVGVTDFEEFITESNVEFRIRLIYHKTGERNKALFFSSNHEEMNRSEGRIGQDWLLIRLLLSAYHANSYKGVYRFFLATPSLKDCIARALWKGSSNKDKCVATGSNSGKV